jgi:SAM-dependent methyltransferase
MSPPDAHRALLDYDPHRFRANVPYYVRFRLNYPERLIARVCALVDLVPGERVMDLGCGPGPLAIAFAKAGLTVTALDPEPKMLEALRIEASRANVEIDAREGSSFSMPRNVGPFKLVTMGRSFHWMDRPQTLQMLGRLIAPGGAVALFHDQHPRTVENRWYTSLRDLANAYGRLDAPHVREREQAGYRAHESILLDSAFSRLERAGVIVRQDLNTDDIVGRAFSLSTLSPDKLGGRAAQFERDLRRELSLLSPDGRFIEVAELTALIAWRSADSDQDHVGSNPSRATLPKRVKRIPLSKSRRISRRRAP